MEIGDVKQQILAILELCRERAGEKVAGLPHPIYQRWTVDAHISRLSGVPLVEDRVFPQCFYRTMETIAGTIVLRFGTCQLHYDVETSADYSRIHIIITDIAQQTSRRLPQCRRACAALVSRLFVPCGVSLPRDVREMLARSVWAGRGEEEWQRGGHYGSMSCTDGIIHAKSTTYGEWKE